MPERDYVTEPIKLGFSGVADFDTIYKLLHKWFKKYKYKFIEKEHKTTKTSYGKNLFFKWAADKKVTDYIKFLIEIELIVSNMVDVKKKGSSKKLCDGDFEFVFMCSIEKDYEDTWAKNAILKFMREVFDKFVTESKTKAFEKEVLEETRKLISEIKSYLDIQRKA